MIHPLTTHRMRYDLEMACNFAQIVLYRPFLHYLRVMADGKAIPLSQSRHALACIKLASTAISRSEAVTRNHPDLPLSWDAAYTLFLAIMCLVFLISAHNGTSHPSEAWRRASVGIRILTANVCVDDCASVCLKVLRMVTRQLNHTVDFDFDEIEATTSQICQLGSPKRGREAMAVSAVLEQVPSPAPRAERPGVAGRVSSHTTSPVQRALYTDADKMLAHADVLPLGVGFTDLLNMDLDGDILNDEVRND